MESVTKPISLCEIKESDITRLVEIFMGDGQFTSVKALTRAWKCYDEKPFIAAKNEVGEIVAFCGIFPIDDTTGSMGYMRVLPAYQRRGIATAFIKKALERLQGKRIILSTRIGVEQLYEKFGFHVIPGLLIYLVKFTLYGNAGRIYTSDSSAPTETGVPIGTQVIPVCDDNIQQVMTYDAALYGGGQRQLVLSRALDNDSISLCAVDEGIVSGYLMFNPDSRYLGLYADSTLIAKSLLGVFASKISEPTEVVWSVIKPNLENAVDILTDLGLTFHDPRPQAVKMSNADTNIRWDKVYGMVDTRALTF